MEEQAVNELVSFEEEHKVVRTNTSYYDLKWGKQPIQLKTTRGTGQPFSDKRLVCIPKNV